MRQTFITRLPNGRFNDTRVPLDRVIFSRNSERIMTFMLGAFLGIMAGVIIQHF